MTLKIPTIIGHRGARGYAPENTIDSIHTAIEMGAKWVEVDVKLTKDYVPVLFHDDTLERTTNGSGNMCDITFADLRELDAGTWFSESFVGTVVPSLEEFLDVALKNDIGINLEIKPCAGREVETAEATLDLLSQVWDDTDRLLISSFQAVSLETSFDMAPEYARGFLMEAEWPENWREIADYLKVSTININGNEISREQIEELMELQKPILAYTINDPLRAQQLRQWGVDSFFTDYLDVVHEKLFRTN